MQTTYINPRACYQLIGEAYPLGIPHLVKLAEEFLCQMAANSNSQVAMIPRRLLSSNLSKRNRTICEMARIDADLVLELDDRSRRANIGLKPYFHFTEFARPAHEQRVVLHIHVRLQDNLQRSISVPFQPLIKGWGDVEEGYQGYAHSVAFLNADDKPDEERFYVGVTSRNWLQRMNEHVREVQSGSNKLFHRWWREYQSDRGVMLNSELVILNHNYEGVMAWEEMMVDRYMQAGNSLNMIPGGFKGLKFLHEHRLTPHEKVSLEERERALEEFSRTHSRIGFPNPMIAGLWLDDDYYTRVITNREKALSPDQVRRIRILHAEGKSIEEIVAVVQALSTGQVQRVIDGQTYTRIK